MAEIETNHFGDDVGSADRARRLLMSNLKDKPKVKLERWAVVNAWEFFIQPEATNGHLAGDVSGHPNFRDGEYVRTSYIVDFDLARRFVETNNTYYELGEPNARYVQFCEEAGVDLEKYGLKKPETTPKKRCPEFAQRG